MFLKVSMSSIRIPPRKWAARLLAKCLLISVLAFLVATALASAADPLGATLHNDGTTTFRVWAPFVDDVAVRINGGAVVPLTKEPGHSDPADTTWTGTVSGTKAGDKYRYVHQARRRYARIQRSAGSTTDRIRPAQWLWPAAAMTISPNPSSWTRTSICRRSPSPLSIRW